MPEWTGQRRKEIYRQLAEGNLDQAGKAITAFKLFKQVDMTPKDAAALKQMGEQILSRPELQSQLCAMVIDPDQSVRRLALFCFGQIPSFPGAKFEEPLRALMGRLFNREFTREEAVNHLYTLNMHNFNKRARGIVVSLVEAICMHPTPEGMGLLRLPPMIRKHNVQAAVYDTWCNDKSLFKKYEKAQAVLDSKAAGDGDADTGKTEKSTKQGARNDEMASLMRAGDVDGIVAYAMKNPALSAAKLGLDANSVDESIGARLLDDEPLRRRLLDWIEKGKQTVQEVAMAWLRAAGPAIHDFLLQALDELLARKQMGWWERQFPGQLRLFRFLLDLLLTPLTVEALWNVHRICLKHDATYKFHEELAGLLYRKYGMPEASAMLSRLGTECIEHGSNVVIRQALPIFLDRSRNDLVTFYDHDHPQEALIRCATWLPHVTSPQAYVEEFLKCPPGGGSQFQFDLIYHLDGCETLEEYEAALKQHGMWKTDKVGMLKDAPIPWDELYCLARYVIAHRRSFDLIEQSFAARYLPAVLKEFKKIPARLKKKKQWDGLEFLLTILTQLYFYCVKEPDPQIRDAYEEFLHAGVRSPQLLREWEQLHERICLATDFIHNPKPWWADWVASAIKANKKTDSLGLAPGWMTLYRMWRDLGCNALDRLIDELFPKFAGLANAHYIVKMIVIALRGLPAYRMLLGDRELDDFHGMLLRHFSPAAPGLAREQQCAYQAVPDESDSALNRDLLLAYLDVPECQAEAAAQVVAAMESGDSDLMDQAFRIAFARAEVFARLGYDLAGLTARDLWQVKKEEAKWAIHRLMALVEHGKASTQAVASALEEVFTIEEPMLWRAAGEAMQEIKRKDAGIKLTYAARIRDILARDPEKYDKYLRPLLYEASYETSSAPKSD